MAWAALVAYLAYFGLTIIVHFAPDALSPVRYPMSAASRTSWGALNRLALACNVFGTLFLVQAIRASHPITPWAVVAETDLLTVALARLALAWLLMDPPGAPPTLPGVLHILFAAISFGAAAAAVNALVVAAPGPSSVAGIAQGLAHAAFPTLWLLLATAVIPPLRRRLFGLTERVFLLIVNIDLVFAAFSVLVGR